MSMIEVHNVGKKFDHVTALEQVSFTVEAGEIVGLLGPNGSGKTTLIRLLCAYFPPTHGQVLIAGYDTRLASFEARRHVGYALEGVVLYPDLTVRDFLEFVRTVKKATTRQLETVVTQCGVAAWLERRIGALSKGYRQRVVLAQALLGEPPILILDEPTAGMDPEMALRMREQIHACAGARTVCLSTHSLAEALQLCHRVLVLYQGRLIAQGTPRELFPGHVIPSSPEELFLQLLTTSTKNQSTAVVGS
jgi:ABC-2 type transport system ATP-binding protein